MTGRKLRVVPDLERQEPPVDIYAALKAKRDSIDWASMHIAADRRAPVLLSDAPKRGWRI